MINDDIKEKIRKCFTQMGEFDPEFQLFDIEETIGNLKALLNSNIREALIDELKWARDMAETDITGQALNSENYINQRIAALEDKET